MASNPWLVGAAVCLLLWAAVSDLRKREISNIAVLGIGALGVLNAGLTADITQCGWQAALAILGVGFVFSVVLPVIGAGDVKLLAAVALWLPGRVWELLLLMAWTGGILALVLLAGNWLLHRHTRDLPYGVAISIPALLMITQMV